VKRVQAFLVDETYVVKVRDEHGNLKAMETRGSLRVKGWVAHS